MRALARWRGGGIEFCLCGPLEGRADHLVEIPRAQCTEHASVLRLHQLPDLLDEIGLADLARIVSSPRLKNSATVRKQVRYDATVFDPGVFGLNMKSTPVVLNVVVETK